MLSFDEDCIIKLWDLENLVKLKDIVVKQDNSINQLYCLGFLRNSDLFLTSYDNCSFGLWEIEDSEFD